MTDNTITSDYQQLPHKGRAGPVFAGNVALENVSYAVGRKSILNNVSLNVEAGQVACILGPSGCGKTTLLRLIAGLAHPDAGRILLDSTEVSSTKHHVPPERRNIGLMFQDYALFPHMTALENVAYGLYALKRDEALRVAFLALERVGLAPLAHQYPSILSGGEQQRVALARAIVPRPQVVMMDEPFSGLDQRLKESVRDETLALLRETRATTLLVTHDPDEALAFADRIFLMGQGRILQAGTPEELLHRPSSIAVAQFFRAHVSLSGSVNKGRIATQLGTISAKNYLQGAAVKVLVPPQGFKILPAGKGQPALIIDNRVQGNTRRLLVQVEGLNEPLLVHSDVSFRGACGLELSGKDTHIFLNN